MAQCLNVIKECAASLSLSNQGSGKYWAKCPAGFVQRIKALGWAACGTGGIASGVPVSTGFTLDVKVDQRPILHLAAPISYTQAATATNAPAGFNTFVKGMIPINDIMVAGEELNIEVTSPADGETIFTAIMELVNLMELSR